MRQYAPYPIRLVPHSFPNRLKAALSLIKARHKPCSAPYFVSLTSKLRPSRQRKRSCVCRLSAETIRQYGVSSTFQRPFSVTVTGISPDRKSVAVGKSVDLGGRRIINKKLLRSIPASLLSI